MGKGQVNKPVLYDVACRNSFRTALFAALFQFANIFTAGAATQFVAVTTVQAQDLRQALAQAYRNNPRLDAARARLRARDEDVSRAHAGWRPVITGNADYGYRSTKSRPRSTTDGASDSWGYSINVTQNLFDGFQSTYRLKGAEASVRAERETLRAIEQQVLMQAVTAYMDVLRDRAILALRRRNVTVLRQQLRAARARRAEHDITRTDVAQARARLARAISARDEALGKLKSSTAVFRQVIGGAPGDLKRPSYRHSLIPGTLRKALRLAEQNHPVLIAAKYREQAERHNVNRIRGELLPDVRLEASYAKRYNGSLSIKQQEDARITGRLTVPLYRGGETYARVRQAKHRHAGRLQEIEQARLEVEAAVMSAWSRLRAARSRLSSDYVQIEAARTALEGVREEEKVGQRTILDVLNAEQELLDARVAMAVTRRDLVVAAYAMIGAIGKLNAQDLSLMEVVYDPEEHYLQVRRKPFGTTVVEHGLREAADHVRTELEDEEYALGASTVSSTSRSAQRMELRKEAGRHTQSGKNRFSKSRQVVSRKLASGDRSNTGTRNSHLASHHRRRKFGTKQTRTSRGIGQGRKSAGGTRKHIALRGTTLLPGSSPGSFASSPPGEKRNRSSSRSGRRQTVPRLARTGQPVFVPSVQDGMADGIATAGIRRQSIKAMAGLRGAMGNEDIDVRARQFRPAREQRFMIPGRRVTIMRGPAVD